MYHHGAISLHENCAYMIPIQGLASIVGVQLHQMIEIVSDTQIGELVQLPKLSSRYTYVVAFKNSNLSVMEMCLAVGSSV